MTRRLLFDVEANGLLEQATKVHCIAAADVDTGERWDWVQIDEALNFLKEADVLIAHNGLRYDLPLLKKLHNWEPKQGAVIRDTMVIARLIRPNVMATDEELILRGQMPAGKLYRGKHSLEAWGHRIGVHKQPYDGGWEEWSQEMHSYMVQDVTTNLALWNELQPDQYSQKAIELEHSIAALCNLMEAQGMGFDIEKAGKLHAELIGKQEELKKSLTKQFGSWFAPVDAHQPFTPKRDNSRTGYVAGAACTKVKLVQFNPGSRDHIIRQLTQRGWQPTEFTPTGRAEINEAVLAGLPAKFPEMQGLSDYLLLDKRLSQLADGDQAWLKVVKGDGRIHGVINPMGTITSRGAHMFPNLGQVPSIRSPWGKECRELFSVPPGWRLVGADMEGLELRGLAHYLAKHDGGKYASIVLDGDPHWSNGVALGLASGDRNKGNKLHTIVRDDGSKTFILKIQDDLAGNRHDKNFVNSGDISKETILIQALI